MNRSSKHLIPITRTYSRVSILEESEHRFFSKVIVIVELIRKDTNINKQNEFRC